MIASAASAAPELVAPAGEAKAWARALGMALVFGVLCWLGTALTRFGGDIASVWPANAVLLGLLVLDERRDLVRRLGLAFLANVAADLWAQSPALEGDRALREVAKVLRRTFQRATDVVTRFGGEEFAVLLPETTAEDAQRLAGKVHQALQTEALEHKDHPEGRVTVSIGVVTTLEDTPPSLAELLERADQALYRAKHAGRNRTEAWAARHDAVEAPIPLRSRARTSRR